MKSNTTKPKKNNVQSEDIPHNGKQTAKRLFQRLAKQKSKLCAIGLCALLSCITYATTPLLVGRAIDDLIAGIRNFNGTSTIFQMACDALMIPAILLIVIAITSALLAYIQQYIVASVGEQLTLSLRQDVSAKLTRLPLRYFDTHKTGDVLSRVTNDLERVSEVMQTGLMQFIMSIFTVIFTVVIMFFLSPLLTGIVLLSLTVSTLATMWVSAFCERNFAENQAALAAINGQIEELYSGNLVLKSFNGQASAIASVCALNDTQYKTSKKSQFAVYAIYPAIRLLNQLGFIATAVVGGFLVISGYSTVGTIQAFLQYVNQLSEPVTQAAYVIGALQGAIAGAERVFALLDEEEESHDQLTPAPDLSSGEISFQQVKFGYTPQNILMQHVNFTVHPNEMVAIVGPTGGGKTTLINLLMRFYELDGGSISIDGVDIATLPRGVLRRSIGMVLQDTWLFRGTVAENIAYGKMDATPNEIESAAKAARCHHFIQTLPNGYDTVISSEASNISQGQMQLLTIARAMLTNPKIMVLDEATSSVDTRTEVEIQKAMAKIMEGKTSFVIAHRLSTIQNADLILVLREGDIVESGTHETLLAQKGFYSALFHSQFEQTS